MDISELYIKMSWQARKYIKKDWEKFLPNQRLGTLICFRSFIGMIINVEPRKVDDLVFIIPETLALRIWGNPTHEDLHIIEVDKDFDDEGFPLLRQDQIQEMLGSFVWTNVLMEKCFKGEYPSEWPMDTWEKRWLHLYMQVKHKKIWDGKKWRKK